MWDLVEVELDYCALKHGHSGLSVECGDCSAVGDFNERAFGQKFLVPPSIENKKSI